MRFDGRRHQGGIKKQNVETPGLERLNHIAGNGDFHRTGQVFSQYLFGFQGHEKFDVDNKDVHKSGSWWMT
ncbi:hypothetical protein SAMN05880590_102170 [Rhizobium sp. RU35A]|nr:hypothetical protein SAMN05880590_102170 [Rhizobium sp. RU35A]